MQVGISKPIRPKFSLQWPRAKGSQPIMPKPNITITIAGTVTVDLPGSHFSHSGVLADLNDFQACADVIVKKQSTRGICLR